MIIIDNTRLPETHDVEAVNSAGHRQAALYEARKKIFPKRASGWFRRFKWLLMLVTLSIYYVTPWLKWDRGPFAPDQAVLLDLAKQRFYFFFIEIWPHEFYYVAGLLVMAGVGLFLITSTVGRAWCGYACPQTVWVDLFIAVEQLIEGDRNARIRLDAAPWSAGKLARRVTKHSVWLLIGLATGGAWIFYFADAPSLLVDFFTLKAPAVAYFTVAILTATTYTFGGLMREQVCTYMCPWPRIQAAMLDEHSLTVTYNDWRGEPRGKAAKKANAAQKPVGDCIDCKACVAVCPMGIDIRDGQQLECITCALCIDACDGVMDKLGRERGLISYATLSDYTSNVALAQDDRGRIQPSRIRDAAGQFLPTLRHTRWQSVLSLRTLIYFFAWAAIGVAMLVALSMRPSIGLNVLHDRNPLFVMLADGSIQNGFDVKVLNMTNESHDLVLSIEGLDGATLSGPGLADQGKTQLEVSVEPDLVLPLRVYVRSTARDLPEQTDFTMVITSADHAMSAEAGVRFEAPEK
ncbi:MAG: cytochrome c oxidase accessory protein CcoG [Candidatus Devosia phytovorans]|uniref:Cytochrome c oxidase accessory protein CcoG n=1 Tax=Candidatus Devosia phytovorans TaxID=3121372 RepID=A0AAJ6B2F8_9HYPH|nr:cytochrome c oxidase accessory protein CcoG [Devosia sp.]WEK06666.1 MAG: cytochrome c oxidase accessory protein CcoG [Devosia sp.]